VVGSNPALSGTLDNVLLLNTDLLKYDGDFRPGVSFYLSDAGGLC
jgi:hypothetical protein